MYNIFNQIN